MTSPDNYLNSVQDINRIDLVEYLGLLGLHPVAIKGQQYRFFSPFRPEPFPSFIVQRDTNTWREGADLRRHSLFEFGVRYHGGTIGDLFETFKRALSAQNEKSDPFCQQDPLAIDPGTVIGKFPLRSPELASYLESHRIPWDIATQYCFQVDVQGPHKIEKTLAFPNSAGGCYLRNQRLNSFLGPRGFTFKDANSTVCAVFTDFEDFLSYQAVLKNQRHGLPNFLILHSSVFIHKSRPIMESHQEIQLFLPRNEAGLVITHDLCQASQKYSDRSQLYTNYQSLNDWTRHIGSPGHPPAEQQLRLRKSG